MLYEFIKEGCENAQNELRPRKNDEVKKTQRDF